MNLLAKLERKYGRYAIRNLSAYVIASYVAGYIFWIVQPQILNYLTLDPYYILKGQIWRLFTWLVIPPSSLDIFTIIMLYFYFSVGSTLEKTWGAFRYNVYIFSGFLFTILGAFVLFAIIRGPFGSFSHAISSYYVNMGILLAFAATYPNSQVYLYFLVPIRIKWLGLLYGALLIADFISMAAAQRIIVGFSMLNFVIFFLFSLKNSHRRKASKISYNFQKAKTARERREQQEETSRTRNAVITKHKCAVCGRTELDSPDLEFRFCSKCQGNYEYCMNHIYTHDHVERRDR